ncbi:uncharacterized protein BP01DRAFT_364213 [Aspergillus saccharolyticus JOP 1030-1]|uniref:Uncharacterized protein n=1 Tax=Aspergillus saccharolyticus JOP 1030-1 TaxID=1450539 RepID=A0A318ZK42_9EURO|nr:hypothetical protein BP01DRAFT_364213 [Aspergillus saccharolyticus JOP 1030-1]PYH47217.1 hypothetical protein BP01DRAFT_364213 [Aspergillus saccharolyticus JOP 1030-1]
MRVSRGPSGLTPKARVFSQRQQQQQQQEQQGQGQTQTLQARRMSLHTPPVAATPSSSTLRKSYPTATVSTSRSRLYEGTISSRSKMVGAAAATTAARRASLAPAPLPAQGSRRASGMTPTPPRRVRWTGKYENLRGQGDREKPSSSPPPPPPPKPTKKEPVDLRAQGRAPNRESPRKIERGPPIPQPPAPPKIQITRAPNCGKSRQSSAVRASLTVPAPVPAPPEKTTAAATVTTQSQNSTLSRHAQPQPQSESQQTNLLEADPTPKARRKSFTHTRIPSLPFIVKALHLDRPRLIARASSFTRVWEAQPSVYWLGRFVTLTNAFHYEDAFQQPDVATGLGCCRATRGR